MWEAPKKTWIHGNFWESSDGGYWARDEKESEEDTQYIRADLVNELVATLKNTTAHLVATHSLLQRGGKKAVASNTMFELMLKDYEKSIGVARAALAKLEESNGSK